MPQVFGQANGVGEMIAPTTYESAMSLLTLAISSLEKYPPVTAEQLTRCRLAVGNLDSQTTRAWRVIENQQEKMR